MSRPYYEDESVTIYHGDCREVLPNIEADAATLVFADPPYGIGKAERTYHGITGPAAEWDADFPLWWMEDAARIAPVLAVTPGVSNIVLCPPAVGRLRYRWTLSVHVTNGMTRGAMGYGNWIPCLVYAAEGVSLYQQVSDVARVAVTPGAKPAHPSPKPLAAVSWMLSVLPAGVVLDPFMGSGTTCLAAKNLGRHSIGIEVDEQYCEVAAMRLSQEVLNLGAA